MKTCETTDRTPENCSGIYRAAWRLGRALKTETWQELQEHCGNCGQFSRNLQIGNCLTKRKFHFDEFNSLKQIVIQRSLLNEILLFHYEDCGYFGVTKIFDWVKE